MEKDKLIFRRKIYFQLLKNFSIQIKKYLRELVSNAVDATIKLKKLASIGEFKGEIGDTKIDISIDKNKTITITDRGIGMSVDEVKKYINQVAFSGAEEFVQKYKEDKKDSGIIGHFGLGFLFVLYGFQKSSNQKLNPLEIKKKAMYLGMRWES